MTLNELQTQFYTAISAPEASAINPRLLAKLSLSTKESIERIDIYRRSRLLSLQKTLMKIYPVCLQFLGSKVFLTLANAYINDHAPTAPDLNSYGNCLPQFIKNHSTISSLWPYLADLCQLEWHWHQVFHGANNTVLDLSALQGAIAENPQTIHFFLPKQAILSSSPYPVYELWALSQPEYTGKKLVCFEPEQLLIWQQQRIVQIGVLTQAEFQFLTILKEAPEFVTACEIAQRQFPELAPDRLLSELVAKGYINSFMIEGA